MSRARLIPPVNFGFVSEDLYRSGRPTPLNFPFLETLGLKTILYLASEDVEESFSGFLDEQGIGLIHLGTEKTTPFSTLTEELVVRALHVLLDAKNYPLCVMCEQGRHRTGTVIGCLRRLERWNLTSIFEEYRRYTGSKVILLNEQFIELFDTSLVHVPQSPPKWWRR